METQPIPLDRQSAIIVQELEAWRNSRYLYQLRYRVNKGLSAPPEDMKRIEDELVRCEQAIDLLKKELDSITEQIKQAQTAPNGRIPEAQP